MAEKAVEHGLAEEAFAIYVKFGKKVEAVKVRVRAVVLLNCCFFCCFVVLAGWRQLCLGRNSRCGVLWAGGLLVVSILRLSVLGSRYQQ